MLAVASDWLLIDFLGLKNVEKALTEAVGDHGFIFGDHVHTTHVFTGVLTFLIVFGLAFMAVGKFNAKVDGKLNASTLFEVILDGVMGAMEGMMDRKHAEKFLPLIGTLAIYIFFSNVLALIPGFAPATDNLNTTVGPALIVFFTTHIVGVRENGLGYFKHFFGPITKWYAFPLMILIFLIEVIGHVARPLSLSVRLFGNMFADHTVLAVFLGLFPFLLPLPSLMLGCIVVTVQTVVFCLLSVIYISLALEHEDDHH